MPIPHILIYVQKSTEYTHSLLEMKRVKAVLCDDDDDDHE